MSAAAIHAPNLRAPKRAKDGRASERSCQRHRRHVPAQEPVDLQNRRRQRGAKTQRLDEAAADAERDEAPAARARRDHRPTEARDNSRRDDDERHLPRPAEAALIVKSPFDEQRKAACEREIERADAERDSDCLREGRVTSHQPILAKRALRLNGGFRASGRDTTGSER